MHPTPEWSPDPSVESLRAQVAAAWLRAAQAEAVAAAARREAQELDRTYRRVRVVAAWEQHGRELLTLGFTAAEIAALVQDGSAWTWLYAASIIASRLLRKNAE